MLQAAIGVKTQTSITSTQGSLELKPLAADTTDVQPKADTTIVTINNSYQVDALFRRKDVGVIRSAYISRFLKIAPPVQAGVSVITNAFTVTNNKVTKQAEAIPQQQLDRRQQENNELHNKMSSEQTVAVEYNPQISKEDQALIDELELF
ncbi:hypothetical protein D5018_01850 [Parashewanella curva]|uniref:Uncharacterized protein n=1 Tax=Parashewanella curva TaxID=2338552 RepID=A0A3L8Q1W5_9GAMM|nr:hypothetical protein [Parashewanella curva]RLV61460.1 hypothetical protein D5018_01850 [Parashewanella curva]